MHSNHSCSWSRFWLASLLVVVFSLGLSARAASSESPSARVIRLSLVSGAVSFSPAGSDDWVVASVNRPLTQGDRLWVERGERAELHIGSTAIRLAGSTGLEILSLTDDDLQLKLSRGSLSMRVRDYPDNEYIEVDTPNLAFEVHQAGEYRIDADADRDHTMVQIRQGSGAVFTDDNTRQSIPLAAGQRVGFSGTDLFSYENGAVGPRDDFERWAAQRDNRENASTSVRYVSRGMTGYEDLDANGDWSVVDGYGPVWMPHVVIRDWAPYQFGHWAWIAPWGWTWIDDEPWGFAPFHYGRWAFIDGRWGWLPGPLLPRPVYAPALVVFIGGDFGPGVRWLALGPGEPYRPAYTHDERYLERVNPGVPFNRKIYVYANQRVPHAVAAMPEADFSHGSPMRPDVRTSMRGQDFSHIQVRDAALPPPIHGSITGAAPLVRHQPPERVFVPAVVHQQAFEPQRMQRQSGGDNSAGVRTVNPTTHRVLPQQGMDSHDTRGHSEQNQPVQPESVRHPSQAPGQTLQMAQPIRQTQAVQQPPEAQTTQAARQSAERKHDGRRGSDRRNDER
jgi:hypothetical protein